MRRICVAASMVMFRLATRSPEPFKSFFRELSGRLLMRVLSAEGE